MNIVAVASRRPHRPTDMSKIYQEEEQKNLNALSVLLTKRERERERERVIRRITRRVTEKRKCCPVCRAFEVQIFKEHIEGSPCGSKVWQRWYSIGNTWIFNSELSNSEGNQSFGWARSVWFKCRTDSRQGANSW